MKEFEIEGNVDAVSLVGSGGYDGNEPNALYAPVAGLYAYVLVGAQLVAVVAYAVYTGVKLWGPKL